MTVGEMLEWTNRFNEILESKISNYFKNLRLAALMTDLEHSYEIPLLNDEDYNAKYPFVIQLFTSVSNARTI